MKSRIGLFGEASTHVLQPISTSPKKVSRAILMEEDMALPQMKESTMEFPRASKIREASPMKDKKDQNWDSSMVKNKDVAQLSQICWRKEELIGCGAFGMVYMGMHIALGELLAVKEVAIENNSVSKKTQIRALV